MAGFYGKWDKHRPVEMLALLASFLYMNLHQENFGLSHNGCEVKNISVPSEIPSIPRLSEY